MANDKLKPICTLRELHETRFLIRQISYKKQPISAIIFAFEDSVLCVHQSLYAHAQTLKLRTGCYF